MSAGVAVTIDAPPRAKTRPDPYRPWRETLLSASRVRELSRPRPLRACRDAAVCWLAIVAAWALVAWWPTWWTVLLAIPVIGNRFYALFVIGHDGLHRRLFATSRANDLFADLVVFGPIGAITRLNNKNHLRHHRFFASEKDPDRHKYACIDKAEFVGLAEYLSGASSLLQSIRNAYLRREPLIEDVDRPAALGEELASRGDRYTLRDLAIIAGWQVALMGGLTATIGWWAYPVLWMAPLYLFTFVPDHFRSFAEHSRPEADEVADDRRLITYVSHPLERCLIAPMNMNLHAAHHLWPSIPYYNLPEADGEIRRAAGAPLEWRGSYFAYLWTYLRRLPIDECRPASVKAP